jgi:hypothetical protein
VALDLSDLSDVELDDYVRGIRAQIVELKAKLESIPSSRLRTVKVVRATFLTTGGILAGAVDAFGFLLVAIGLWDWIETLSEDAQAMNTQNSVSGELKYLQAQLGAMESEIQRRTTFDS